MLDVLRGILGADRAVAVERGDPRYAPHIGPMVHALPRTRDEVAAVLRAATRDRFVVVPVGGNTAPRVGRNDEGPICLLSTEFLDRATAYEPGDQTITIEAGVSVEAIDRIVARDRLFVAFDPPRPDRATVGGIVAAASEGGTVGRYGPIKDQILGVVFATGDGRVASAGGRVVKNVTGYDLSRLHVGARGAYGVILEVTARLRPLPEAAARSIFTFDDENDAYAAALSLRAAAVDAATIFVVSGAAAETFGGGVRLVVGVDGYPVAIRAARAAIERVLGRAADAHAAVDPPHRSLVEAPEGAAVVRLAASPPRWRELRAAANVVVAAPFGAVFDALRGVRETWHDPASRLWNDDAALDALIGAAGVAVDLPRDPTFHRVAARLPSLLPRGVALMKRLKRAFDPAGILNPGRSLFDAAG